VPPVQSVTTAPENLQDDQSTRIKRYLFTMGIRTASFILAFLTEGWVRWTFVVLAVFLPYFAVVMANAVAPRAFGRMQKDPGPSSNFHIPQ
jgi:hypothetical protein